LNKILIFYWEVLKESFDGFLEEDMPTHAAALSYNMIFSLPSMLLIVIWIADIFYGEVAVGNAIFAEFGSLVGEDGARQIMATLENLEIHEPTWWASTVAVLVLLYFATTVYDVMRNALNHLAQVKTSTSLGLSIWRLVRIRVIAVALLICVSFLMLVFLMLDALIATVDSYLASFSGSLADYFAVVDAYALNFFTTTILFALYFRYLPDVRLRWRDTWFGALLTAFLYLEGKALISLIIGNSEAADLYDAAGSILVLMLWVYYAAAIFLFGATVAFTRARKLNIGLRANAGRGTPSR